MLAIIISTFNEAKNSMLWQTLENLIAAQDLIIICVDGGSTDGSLDKLKSYPIQLINLPNSTRAARLNKGIEVTDADTVLLHHPRSILSDSAIQYLLENHQQHPWAAFSHKFDHEHLFLKFISWYSNNVRVKKKNIVYLDHCMLISKQYLTKPIPDIAIFEDTALSEMLGEQGLQAVLLPEIATTSAIRFIDRGVYKQFCMNQLLKVLYKLKLDAKKLNKLYEKHLNLNQKN